MTTARTDLSDDTRLLHEFAQWRDRTPGADALRLARLVAGQVRRSGRHRLGDGLLATLDALHRRHHGRDAFLDAYLGAVLARRHNRFRNQTYLALPLVELAQADLGVGTELMSALLIADVVRHERRAENAAGLNPRTRDARIRHAMRFVAAVDPALDVRWQPGEWFALTALPVSREHDEYFFIRAQQAHEMVFSTLTAEVHEATAALRAEDIATATAHVTRAKQVFGRAEMLLRLVATVRPASFESFRRYTKGANAFQSEAYTRFAVACGTPGAEQLVSETFDNVAAAGAEAPRLDNFTCAWHDLVHRGPELADLTRAIDALESAHQQWRTTHRYLAASLLGSAHGPDNAEGMRYLLGCLDDRLFDLGSAAITSPRHPVAA